MVGHTFTKDLAITQGHGCDRNISTLNLNNIINISVMYKKSKSGIFRPYKGIYRNEKGEVIFTEEFDEDIARRKKFYEQIDRRIEQAKLAKEQEELARKEGDSCPTEG